MPVVARPCFEHVAAPVRVNVNASPFAPVGVVQGPVKTQFGYHLLEVTSRQD